MLKAKKKRTSMVHRIYGTQDLSWHCLMLHSITISSLEKLDVSIAWTVLSIIIFKKHSDYVCEVHLSVFQNT